MAAGELRQDDNTKTTNEGFFDVEAGAIFAATTGNDLFVNKSVLSNGGSVALTNGASWTQEAGAAKETGAAVAMHAGTLTDVSGTGSFDLVDTTSLNGTVPKGQTVTADAEPSHNSIIDIAGTVLNEGTLALSSPPSGGEATLAGTSSQLDNDGVLSARSESSNANFLEMPLTNAAGEPSMWRLANCARTTTQKPSTKGPSRSLRARSSRRRPAATPSSTKPRWSPKSPAPKTSARSRFQAERRCAGRQYRSRAVGGYSPAVGTEFDVITSTASISGEFSKFENGFEGDHTKADTIAVRRSSLLPPAPTLTSHRPRATGPKPAAAK